MSQQTPSRRKPLAALGCGCSGITLGILAGIIGGFILGVFACMGMFTDFLEGFPEFVFGEKAPPRSFEANLQTLKNRGASAEARGEAIQQISKEGQQAEEAVPYLLEALRDRRGYRTGGLIGSRHEVHREASKALAKIGGPKVVQGLSELLSDKDEDLVVLAADTLASMKPTPEGAVPALLGALKKRVDEGRDSRTISTLLGALASAELKADSPQGEQAIPVLREIIQRRPPVLGFSDCQHLFSAYRELAPDDPEILPALIGYLDDPKRGPAAAAELRHFGVRAAPSLVPELSSPGEARQARIVALFRQMPAGEAVNTLQGSLTDSEPKVRAGAAIALTAIGTEAKPAVPALEKLVADPDPRVRLEAAWALWAIAHRAESFPVLVSGLKDPRTDVKEAARKKLDQIGPKDAWAVDELVKYVGAEEKPLRLESVQALGRMGKQAGKAKAILVKALSDPDEEFRVEVAKALAKVSD